MTSVIAGSTRNPCRAGDAVVIGAWIAGQARNDSVEVCDFGRHARKSKAACGWTVPRNQDTSPGLFALVAPQDVRGAEGGSHPAFVN